MNRYFLIAPLAIFGFAGLGLYWYFVQPGLEGAFHDNLVPELIGFCIEGFFLVGLLSYFQQVRELDRRKALWLSLRGSLREILSHLDMAFLAAHAEPRDSQLLENEPKVVDEMLAALKDHELDLPSMVAVKQAAIDGHSLIHDLIPVAAQLSAAHMRWWIAISDSTHQLTVARARADLERGVYQLLVNLREFDDLKI